MLAAYKLRLGRKARELGLESAGTWGKEKLISSETEERLLAGEGEFRLSPFPYPGLRSFDPKEGKLFFGRETSVAEVRKHLESAGIVTVLGGSGSGKSSLVRAGLLPFLNNKQRIPGRPGSWYVAEFRPRTNPQHEFSDALADQVMLPLLDLEAPGLAEEMGLKPGERGAAAKHKLRDKMRQRFDAAQAQGREAVRDALLEFVDRELDDYDRLASEGVRVPGASLMLLVDQFEEVFRPEIGAGQRKALLDLIVDLDARIANRNERNERTYKGGLFLVITMRSEELHRCAEHRGLSEVVNRSLYLLELLDPDNEDDAKELRKAIVQPARDVLDDWGIAYDRDKPDAPFADGMPNWLLSGAGRRLPHQPDQLPLLQHALQATWHGAMRRWSEDDFADSRLEIRRQDLPGRGDSASRIPDLGRCLSVRADKAAARARECFAEKAGTSMADGEAALQAAFRALAQRDDRGRWARRFADIGDIMAFLAADPNSAPARAPKEAVQDALSIFLLRGYLSGGNGAPYDISHEALIRNWPSFQNWLRDVDSTVRALERVTQEIDPRISDKQSRKLLDWIPKSLSDQLAPVLGPRPTLPRSWALQHLEPMLERSALKERWQGLAPNVDSRELAQTVLKTIDDDRQAADRERGREDSRRFFRKFALIAAPFAALALLLVGSLLWVVFQKSVAAVSAAHADALLGVAISDHGAQLPHDLRARVTLRAVSYFDAASKLDLPWFPDDLAQLILKDILQERLPFLTNEDTQKRARRAFDSASRNILGRNVVVTKLGEDSTGIDFNLNCAIIGDPSQSRAVNRAEPDWQKLPRPLTNERTNERHLRPAFRIQDGVNLQFGVAIDGGEPQEVKSDFQDTLPLRSQLCLSSDATVLTLSSPGQGNPDLYDLQWTPCATESHCKSDWRVRAVPIRLVPGAEDLSSQLQSRYFPCVISITSVPVSADAARQRQSPVKVQVRYNAQETAREEAECPGRLVTRSLQSPSRRPVIATTSIKPSDIFMMEFFTELAVPRTVEISNSVKELLTECKEDKVNSVTDFICTPKYLIAWSESVSPKTDATIQNNTNIRIRKRPQEDEILEVDVLDDNSVMFAALKVSLPARGIDRAGITTSGEVLLRDDHAGVTWRFVAARSGLEERLRQRSDCSHMQNSDPRVLGELAKLNIDSVCSNVGN
jgi:hypothetical protein